MNNVKRLSKHDTSSRWSARAALLAVSAVLAGGAAMAGEDAPLPTERDAGAVSYREGGIGRDEAQAMRAASDAYPLMLSFSENLDGAHAYTTDVDVSIESRDGATLLDTHAEAPLMLIDLPRGVYEVTASLDGQEKSQTVHVQPQQTQRVYFEWKGI